MARYIDADALIDRMKKDPLFPLVERYGVTGVIEAEPTADVVEVVRCKYCAHHEDIPYTTNVWCEKVERLLPEDWFCADGERREDD